MSQLADIASRLGYYDDAEFLLEKATSFDPNDADLRMKYLMVLRKTQKFSKTTQQVDILKDREVLYEKQIKLVRPKWYENKWLYFTFGVIATSVSVKLAGEIVD